MKMDLYRCRRTVAEKFGNLTQDCLEKDGGICPEKEEGVELMVSDFWNWTMTENKEKNSFVSNLFCNAATPEDDESGYKTMNREQCLVYIKTLRNDLHEWYKHNSLSCGNLYDLQLYRDPAEVAKLEKSHPDIYKRVKGGLNASVSVARFVSGELQDFNFSYMSEERFDEAMNNPYMVNFSGDSRAQMDNLIHIYKIMDWDNDIILIREY